MNGPSGKKDNNPISASAQQAALSNEDTIGFASIGILSLDCDGTILFARGRLFAALAITQEQLVDQSVFEFFDNEAQIVEGVEQALKGGAPAKAIVTLGEIACEVSTSPVYKDAFSGPCGVVMVISDVSDWVVIEEELRRQAHFDKLTKLPSRNYLIERLDDLINTRPVQPFSIIALGISRFREINSTFGFAYGDQVLKEIGAELQVRFGPEAFVSRIGGDEFGIILKGEKGHRLASHAAAKAVEVFNTQFHVAGNSLALDASLGLAVYPGQGHDAEVLLQNAMSAGRIAKERGDLYTVYSAALEDNKKNNIVMLSELRSAIDQHELRLQYQPKITLKDRKVSGVEALLRWHHPINGVIAPDEFIPLAESTGVIRPMTQWVANAAARQLVEWEKQGCRLPIAINLSSRAFESKELVDELFSVIEHWGLDPHTVELEITETAVMNDIKRASTLCREITDSGVTIAIDDFGVGYSPLAYLRDLCTTYIKIDQSFINTMRVDDSALGIVESLVMMGKRLGVLTIAEGVENQETLDLLTEMGCDQAQGYFISRPMDADAVGDWLAQYNCRDS